MVEKKDRDKYIIDLLDEISLLYSEVKEYYNEVIISTSNKPAAPLIEIENFFSHLMQGLSTDNDESNCFIENLSKAKGHIERMVLDIIKLLWIEKNKDILRLIGDKVLKYDQYLTFKEKSTKARNYETECLGKDKMSVIKVYKEAIEYGSELIKNRYNL